MRERILENWLDSSNERTFEVPFCFMLLSQGYTIIHMTRHGNMEMGKDIIAIDPQGIPCAFQLKSSSSKRITLTQWREIERQVNDLMLGKIVHPSFSSSQHHRSYLVTNRDLDNEVTRMIDDLNRGWESRGHPEIRLETISRYQLLKMALDHIPILWPTELADAKTLLELFLDDGQGLLPRASVSHLLETTMGLNNDVVPSVAELVRKAASSAVLCGLAISPWSRAENYAAEIEAWTIHTAVLLAACERWGISQYHIRNSLEIANDVIFRLLGKLCEELRMRSHLVEGNALADPLLRPVRVTQLVGLMSVYGLWQMTHGQQDKEHFEFVREFCLKKGPQMMVWGEGAVPQFLAYYWFLKEIDASPKSDFMLMGLLEHIAFRNGKRGPSFADPYHDAEDALLEALGFSEEEARGLTKPSSVSYMAKGLLHLSVKRNWKQHLRNIWPDLTRLAFLEFKPAEPWQYYLWRSEHGTNVTEYPPLTKHWEDLRNESFHCQDNSLPAILREHSVLMLLFIMTYPHRAMPDAVKWLDKMLRKF